MTLADNIVTEARTWKNTPFRHQGRLKGLGVDCAGFIGEVARNAGVVNVDIPNDYKPQEDGTAMMALLSQHLDFVPTEDVKAGDVLALCDEALRFPDIPRHLAFVTEVKAGTIFLIHASEHGVREHRTNEHWRKRIHSVWRLREGVNYDVGYEGPFPTEESTYDPEIPQTPKIPKLNKRQKDAGTIQAKVSRTRSKKAKRT